MVVARSHVLVVGLVAVTAACGSDGDVIARIGERRASIEAFQDYVVAVTGEAWQGVSDAVASRLFDQFLDQEVLIAAADRERAYEPTSDVASRSARVRQLVDVLCGPAPPPSDDAVAAALDAENAETRPARARVRQMLLSSLEEAENARRQLDDGADFVELSRRVSRAPNADVGGDLGLLTQGGLSDDLDSVIFALDEGEISDPVQGPSGYHIFQVLEVVPPGLPPRAELEPEVRRRLTEEAARQHAADCVRDLAREVGVDIVRDSLWFEYRGRYAD
ncbi:MAG: peptidylprolyl isomerase [Holophagae bacterium]|jgi:parvulin-like peptidyl-prolyl isomerase